MTELRHPSPEDRIREREETVCLSLCKKIGRRRFRYILTEADGVFALYVEYKDDTRLTEGSIPALSTSRGAAVDLCRAFAKQRVTPWSLEDVYQDMYTP